MFTYPTDTLDDLQVLAELVGSFWVDAYGGVDSVVDLLRTHRRAGRQLAGQGEELAAAVGRTTCPVFHTQDWYALVLNRSAEEPADPGSYPGGRAVSYALPAAVVDGILLTSGIASASVILHAGTDFRIDDGHLILLQSPFADARLQPETVAGDEQLTLWLFRARRDWRYVQDHFATEAGIDSATSSAGYRNLVNAILDATAGGTSDDTVARLAGAAAGISFVRSDREIVEAISAGRDETIVITDRDVYKFPAGSTALVAAGDAVRRGDALVDTVRSWACRDGPPPFLTEITVGEGMLAAGIGPLTFTDANTALVVTTNVSGYTKLTWALGGDSGDVTAFFTALHARGVAAGATLANYLDLRTVKVGQPDATMLPTTINPFRFLFENVLKHNAIIIRLRPALYGPDAFGATALAALRRVLSPHTAALVIVA